MLLARAHGLHVTAHHVDHRLRTESHHDLDTVQLVAERFGVEVVHHIVDVGTGPNLEARARAARYSVLPDDVMTGHTADDQAETIVINLLRGAASQGLSGMTPGHKRPLLAIRRSETHRMCADLGITPVDDETNRDMSFLRNNVRHRLLPLMNELSKRDLVPILSRAADVLRDDDDFLDELSLDIDPTDALALARAPRPLATRAVRRWLANPYPPDQATVERVLDVAAGVSLACDVGDGHEVRRSKQRLHLQKVR
jgi:tRNA(Ile)-lysidine synthase